MATGHIKGITIEFSADVQKLNKGLKTAHSALSSTQSELKAVNRALRFNPANTTLLKQKMDLLKKAVADTEGKLESLEKLQRQMDADNVDKNSSAYRELEREIIKTKDQLDEAIRAEQEFGSVGKQQALAVSAKFKELGSKISSVGRSMSMTVSAPIVAGFTASAKYASDFEENLNKIDVAFGKNAKSVKNWAKTAGKQFGLSQVQATGSASAFGALAKGIGLSDKASAEMSTSLAGLSADLGSYFNMSNDESAKALEGIFTGESEALKRFGVVMLDTNLKKFADEQGLVWESMTEAEKATLRYQYVLEKTKDAQGDYARTSDGTANSIKTFKASIQDLATVIGANLLPIITPIIQKLTEWIKKFSELPPSIQKIITVVGIIVAVLGPLLVVIGSVISAIGVLIPVAIAVGGALAPIAGIVAGVAVGIGILVTAGVALYKNWDFLKAKASEVWNGIKNGISKAVTVIKTKVTSNFNALKNTVTTVWNTIKNSITRPITKAKDTVSKAIDAIKKKFNSIKKLGGKIFSGLKLPRISVRGGKAPFGIGGKGSLPKFSVRWNAQAMDNPYMFSNATLFGAGEAGDEILYGRKALMRDIANASGGGGEVVERLTAIESLLGYYLPKGQQIVMDNGALIGQVNRGLGLKI